jgi:hypothetical protein
MAGRARNIGNIGNIANTGTERDHGGPRLPKGPALINHVWMTRLDDELYSGLDDLNALDAGPEVTGLGGPEQGEDVEGLT